MSDISKNIKKYRKQNHFSQEQLAAHLNVTRQTISNWETDRSYPDLDMVVRLSEALGTDPNHLLYPQDAKGNRILPTLSPKPIFAVFFLFFLSMTWGGAISVPLFQKLLGGGVDETFLYPIYAGIILLAVLVAICTCVILEEIRSLGKPD